MDVLTFLKEYSRMCNSYISEWNCNGCPRETEPTCEITDLGSEGIKKLISDVDQWSKKHPQKTRLQDFLEKYPNAPVDGNGTPQACCEHLGYCTKSCDPFELTCKDCWDIPIGDDE